MARRRSRPAGSAGSRLSAVQATATVMKKVISSQGQRTSVVPHASWKAPGVDSDWKMLPDLSKTKRNTSETTNEAAAAMTPETA